MFRYAIFACLFLLANSKEILEDARVRFHKSPVHLLPNHLIAPELLQGRETFVVLDYEAYAPQLRVSIRKYNDHRGISPRECNFDYRAKTDTTKLGVSDFRRLGEEKVIFAWYEETSSGNRTTNVIVVNIQLCSQFDFQPKEFPGRAILVPSVSESFDVLVNDAKFCKHCRFSYDLNQYAYGRNLTFNVSLDWSTMYVERLNNGAFLIRGYENDTYKISSMNHLTKELKELIFFRDPEKKMDIASSGLAYCWILNAGVDRDVFCEMVVNERKDYYWVAIKYDEPVRLIDVHPIEGTNEIFVITKRVNCKNEQDCWLMWGTKVRAVQTTFEHLPMHFPCTGEQKGLTVFDAKADYVYNKMDLHYSCRRNDSYTFSVFWVY